MNARTAIDAGLFLCAGIGIGVLMTYRMVDWLNPAGLALAVSSLALVGAAVLVVWKRQAARWLGLVASAVAAVMFVRLEVITGWNSWVCLNLDDAAFEPQVVKTLVKVRLMTPALVVIALSNGLFRRAWLRFGAPIVVLGAWYVYSVTLYRVPGHIGDGIPPEFRLVHFEKRGLRIQETAIAVFRDGKVWTIRQDRRLFQYQFEQRVSLGALEHRTAAIVHAAAIWRLQTGPVKRLSAWDTEAWCVALNDGRVFKFAAPPREVEAMFDEIERLPRFEQSPRHVRDVCLGFCYKPFGLDL
jgi:hypothetical protein